MIDRRLIVSWILNTWLGWTLAAGTSYMADSLVRSHSIRGITGALAYLGILLAGGLVLGAFTGICLAWMPRREPAA